MVSTPKIVLLFLIGLTGISVASFERIGRNNGHSFSQVSTAVSNSYNRDTSGNISYWGERAYLHFLEDTNVEDDPASTFSSPFLQQRKSPSVLLQKPDDNIPSELRRKGLYQDDTYVPYQVSD